MEELGLLLPIEGLLKLFIIGVVAWVVLQVQSFCSSGSPKDPDMPWF